MSPTFAASAPSSLNARAFRDQPDASEPSAAASASAVLPFGVFHGQQRRELEAAVAVFNFQRRRFVGESRR